jgi:hypothetical protein
LLPALSATREQARAVKCQNNIRTLWEGFVSFAAAHENRLPGGEFDGSNPDPDKRDWMQGSQVNNYLAAPQQGTLFRYVGHNYDVYRCPSLELAAVANGTGPGGGSNGRFDYSAFLYATGCRLDRLPPSATVMFNGQSAIYPAPLIVEEEAQHMNGSHQMEAGHSSTDTLANTHRGGSFYGATDGSVQWIGTPWINAPATDWFATSIRGKTVSLGYSNSPSDPTWGFFERQ